MMDWDMARTTRSGTKVGPGIWRKGRPGMRPTSYPGSGGRGGRAILPAMTKAELPTPALLLDLDRFERNLQKMAAHVKAVGKKIRPHAKTHKCPEIARRQIAAGGVGVCVAQGGGGRGVGGAGGPALPCHTQG